MSRKRKAPVRKVYPDPKFHSEVVSKFINSIMYDGKRSTAEKILYDALDKIKSKNNEDPIKIFNTAISNVASLRAEAGATSSRLDFSSDYLSTSMVHLEEANSRIVDVDVAAETTNMAKYNLQVYAASAALVQSNLNMSIVLDLLNFNSFSKR